MNTGNAIKIIDAGGLKVTRAVPEKHIINFFGLKMDFKSYGFLLYEWSSGVELNFSYVTSTLTREQDVKVSNT